MQEPNIMCWEMYKLKLQPWKAMQAAFGNWMGSNTPVRTVDFILGIGAIKDILV